MSNCHIVGNLMLWLFYLVVRWWFAFLCLLCSSFKKVELNILFIAWQYQLIWSELPVKTNIISLVSVFTVCSTGNQYPNSLQANSIFQIRSVFRGVRTCISKDFVIFQGDQFPLTPWPHFGSAQSNTTLCYEHLLGNSVISSYLRPRSLVPFPC